LTGDAAARRLGEFVDGPAERRGGLFNPRFEFAIPP
jgi:hypothetical protein